jgi:hypothetical protein
MTTARMPGMMDHGREATQCSVVKVTASRR